MCCVKVAILILLMGAASVPCQAAGRDMDAIMLDVFGPPPIKAVTVVPEGSSCITADNVEGECLIKRKCLTGGLSRLIQSSCNRLQVCCPPTPTTSTPITTSTLIQSFQPLTGCGIRNMQGVGTRILGQSADTIYTEFPWMVAVYTRNETRRTRFLGQFGHESEPSKDQELSYTCGGSLINLGVVLTAGHCVFGKRDVRVRAGDWDLDSQMELLPYQEQMASKIIVHYDFDSESLEFDAALLILTHAFTEGENIGVICLPPASLSFQSDSQCMATGWGMSHIRSGNYENKLKVVELPLVSHFRCQYQLKSHLSYYFRLHYSFMCAGGKQNEDTCKGDGGSPLICYDNNGRYYQHGIVSWGIECGNANIPGVYTNVIKLRQWIDDQMTARGFSTSSYTYSLGL